MPPVPVKRILVVDDQGELAEMMAWELADRGYEAVAVSSGTDALQRLKKERFDVVVTDLSMPEVDGLMLLRASRELDPTRPVIMVTAFGTLQTAVEATANGAYHYVTKPLRAEVLSRLIREALQRA
ncbi:MAG: response regulator [Myxococcota bacterium]|nr:response regulator [Myxococcota bacterium]